MANVKKVLIAFIKINAMSNVAFSFKFFLRLLF